MSTEVKAPLPGQPKFDPRQLYEEDNFNIMNATHPFGCFFHIFFKVIAVVA